MVAYRWAAKKSLAEPKTKGPNGFCRRGARSKDLGAEKHKLKNCKRKTQTTRSATKVCRYKKCGLLEWPPPAHRWWNKIEYTSSLAAGG